MMFNLCNEPVIIKEVSSLDCLKRIAAIGIIGCIICDDQQH